jgi:uncharacterized phiE125 gp8 family phage protein
MNITILTQPEFEPVSLPDCYSHLRLDPDADSHPDDTMLRRHMKTARRDVERITNRALVTQKLRLTTNQTGTLIALPRPPLISIVSVSVYDSAGELQVIDPDDYEVIDDLVPKLKLTTGLAACSRADALRVDYWAGYPAEGSPGTDRAALIANVPSEAVDAILLGVQLLYDQLSPEQRETIIQARKSLLSGLVVHGFA